MNTTNEKDAKRLARLSAVQGLYRIEMTQHPANEVIKDFQTHPASFLQEIHEGKGAMDADKELFAQIVNGVTGDAMALDKMIAGALDSKVSAGRIEILLRAILRAGTYELHNHGPIPTGVVINDYVDVAHAFFDAKEPGLVNAVLDKLAKNLRAS